jgi:hypothetical protein
MNRHLEEPTGAPTEATVYRDSIIEISRWAAREIRFAIVRATWRWRWAGKSPAEP